MKRQIELLEEIAQTRANWDERSCFEVDGIGNLSQSDLDSLVLYTDTYLKYGDFRGLMEPRGNIEKILAKYGMEHQPTGIKF